MRRPSDPPEPDWDHIRELFLGLDESLSVKSYYPQLKARLRELEEERQRGRESEARLKAAFENLPFAFWSASSEGVVALTNDLSSSRYGMKREASLRDLPIDPELKDLLLTDFMGALAGRVERSERPIHEGKALCWIHSIVSPIAVQGRIIAVLGVDIDITELKRAEKALERLNDDLESKVAERTEKLEGTILELQSAQDKLVLSEKLAALGRVTAGVAHELNSPLGAIESSSVALLESVNRIALDMPSLYRDLGDEIYGIFSTLLKASLSSATGLTEINDRVKRREIRKRLRELHIEDADVLSETVLEAGLFNELESMISYIDAARLGRLLRALSSVYAASRSCSIIHYAAKRSTQVVRTLKSFEIGEVPTDRYEVDNELLNAVDIDADLRTTLELYLGRMIDGVKLDVRLESGARVFCDAAAMSQVWVNVLNNALQAMAFKGTLSVKSRRSGSSVLVEIVDTGVGIRPEDMPHVFEPFFTTKPMGEGTGFGLVVAKRIVERVGGSISFESEPGHTVFRITLPILSDDQKTD